MRSTQIRTPDFGENILTDVSYTNTGSAPISTADAKSWAKIDYSDDDTLIGDLIDEVIDTVENELNITIVDKTVTATYQRYAKEIPLPFKPVSSITSVKTLDKDDTTTLTANEEYYLRGNTLFVETLQYSADPYDNVGLEVVYDTAWSSLPNGIVLGLKKAILSNYEDRQDIVGGMSVAKLPNSSWKHLKRYKNYA